jgi:hypothetical protein
MEAFDRSKAGIVHRTAHHVFAMPLGLLLQDIFEYWPLTLALPWHPYHIQYNARRMSITMPKVQHEINPYHPTVV